MKKYFSLKGYLSEESISRLIADFTNAVNGGCEEVIFNFDTPGGNLWGALEFAEVILKADKKSLATIEQKASSAAVPIFLACKERVIGPRSRILIHDVEAKALNGLPDSNDSLVMAKNRELSQRLEDFIVLRSCLAKEEVKKILKGKGKYFNAQEALEAGLVTKIDSVR